MSDDETGPEPPERRPDVWLPPGSSSSPSSPGRAGATPSGPPTWSQPPGWRPPGPAGWQQPPRGRRGRRPRSEPGSAPGPHAARPRDAQARAAATAARRSRANRRFTWAAVTVAVLPALVGVTLHLAGVGSDDRPGGGTRSGRTTPGPPLGTVATAWTREPDQLRPGLTGASFLGSLDGSFEQSYVRELDGVWLTVTGSDTGAQTALHALDPASGAERWQRELDGVLCATDVGSLTANGSTTARGAVYCASVLERDRATGLGTRWRLHALDPGTGEDLATADVDAWVTAVHWSRGTFVLLEQRQPAPHAVVRGFSADLRERWSVDLVDRPGQADLFTEDRVVLRPEPGRPGLALDRPRLRDVGGGLLAVWAGQQTAVVEPGKGRLVMMPHCSRLVDDGDRLWCNEVDGATAYSYAGRELVRVRGPRLAFPGDDGVGEDRNRPVFLNDDGAAVSVDVRTGKVGDAWTPPGRGSAFGQTTMPSAETAGGRTFLVGKAGAMLLDATSDRVVWRDQEITTSDVPIARGGTALLGSSRATEVDLATGVTRRTLRFEGLYVVALGDRVAGVGPDRVNLARY